MTTYWYWWFIVMQTHYYPYAIGSKSDTFDVLRSTRDFGGATDIGWLGKRWSPPEKQKLPIVITFFLLIRFCWNWNMIEVNIRARCGWNVVAVCAPKRHVGGCFSHLWVFQNQRFFHKKNFLCLLGAHTFQNYTFLNTSSRCLSNYFNRFLI